MQAVWFQEGKVTLVEQPTPRPGAGEALLRVRCAGICNTDLELLAGYYGFAGVPGHELVAEVVQAPEAPELVGRRVVADINLGCGECPRCRAGDPRHCPRRRVVGIKDHPGAFAEYLCLPTGNLHLVPEELADQRAVFCEPLAAALEVGQQVHLTGRTRLLVLGDGKLGLLAALGLRHWCPGLVLAGRHPDKLAVAQAQGVRTVSAGDDPRELLQRLGGPFQVVVEATGRPQGLAWALELVEPEGTVVAKTTSHQPSRLDLARLVVNEVNLLGSRCGDMALALHFLAEGLVDPTPLIEATYPLARFPEALERARRPGARKVIVEM